MRIFKNLCYICVDGVNSMRRQRLEIYQLWIFWWIISMITYLRMREYQLYTVTSGMELASKANIVIQPYSQRSKIGVLRMGYTRKCCPYLFKSYILLFYFYPRSWKNFMLIMDHADKSNLYNHFYMPVTARQFLTSIDVEALHVIIVLYYENFSSWRLDHSNTSY